MKTRDDVLRELGSIIHEVADEACRERDNHNMSAKYFLLMSRHKTLVEILSFIRGPILTDTFTEL